MRVVTFRTRSELKAARAAAAGATVSYFGVPGHRTYIIKTLRGY